MNRRTQREARTLAAMVRLYCQRSRHQGPRPCQACASLLEYALARLEKCPFQDGKPTCANCHVHCYRADMRERIREVMREAGPHMIYRHPILAFMHLIVDARRRVPDARTRRRAS